MPLFSRLSFYAVRWSARRGLRDAGELTYRQERKANWIWRLPTRFDVLAINDIPGRLPVMRLHKDAFSPQLPR
jgi:hypothetical protein